MTLSRPHKSHLGVRILWFSGFFLLALPTVVYAPWLLMASWCAYLTQGWHKWLSERWGRPSLAATAIVITILLFAVIPFVFLAISIAEDLPPFVSEVTRPNGSVAQFLRSWVPARLRARLIPNRWDLWIQNWSGSLWAWSQSITSAVVEFVGSLVVFFLALYVFLLHGSAILKWIYHHLGAPILQKHFYRCVTVIKDAGHALIVGVGITGFAQAAVATMAYGIAEVPSPFVFGALTFVCSLLPSIGTSLVWIPVAIGLLVVKRYVAAAFLFFVGAVVVSLIDNIVRPWVSSSGTFELHWFLFILSIFGGVATLGVWGFVLGPLFVRLGIEVLDIVKEAQMS